MQGETKLILTAPPTAAREATSHGLPVGHMAYRVGPGAHLLRANIPINLRGGLMVVDGSGFDGRGDAGPFCQQVIRECSARGFDGVILDFEGSPHPLLGQIANRLGTALSRRSWPLYVTEEYAGFSDQARIIIPSALSGGSLSQRLTEAVERYGAERVALGVQRIAEDFTLPPPAAAALRSAVRSCPGASSPGARPSSFPMSCARTILPTCPGKTGPTSSCSTTRVPFAKSFRSPAAWPARLHPRLAGGRGHSDADFKLTKH